MNSQTENIIQGQDNHNSGMSERKNDDVTLQDYYTLITRRTPLQLKYQFLIRFKSVDFLNQSTGIVSQDELTLLCQSSTIPKRTMTVTNTNFYGKKFQMPGTETFQHKWSTKILLTNEITVYYAFKKWLTQFSSLQLNCGGQRRIPDSNIEIILLNQYSTQSNAQKIVLFGAFPSKVGKISLAYTDANADAQTFDIEFTYQYSYTTPCSDTALVNDPLKQNNDRSTLQTRISYDKSYEPPNLII